MHSTGIAYARKFKPGQTRGNNSYEVRGQATTGMGISHGKLRGGMTMLGISMATQWQHEDPYGRSAMPASYGSGTAAQGAIQVSGGQEGRNVGRAEARQGAEPVKKGECQTCKNRKYVDGSDEGNVSFQAPGHISPQASGAKVMSHEKEHVANARREGSEDNKQLVSASISLKMAVCPECGRSYVAGGETRTTMRTTYSANPYDQARKTVEGSILSGQNVDTYV